MAPLDTDTQQKLIHLYKSIPSPTNKWGIIWALGMAGNEEALRFLENDLTNGYRGRTLTYSEEGKLKVIIRLLGVRAAEFESAYQFVLKGAAFYYSMRHQYGKGFVCDELLLSLENFAEYSEKWESTPEGKDWDDWRWKVVGLGPPLKKQKKEPGIDMNKHEIMSHF